MPYMKVVIDALKEQGIRDDYIVMVGGAPLSEEFGEAVGADTVAMRQRRQCGSSKSVASLKANELVARLDHRLRALAAEIRIKRLIIGPASMFGVDAALHNRPERIAEQLEQALDKRYPIMKIVIAYADCGTGGGVDRVAKRFGAERCQGSLL